MDKNCILEALEIIKRALDVNEEIELRLHYFSERSWLLTKNDGSEQDAGAGVFAFAPLSEFSKVAKVAEALLEQVKEQQNERTERDS